MQGFFSRGFFLGVCGGLGDLFRLFCMFGYVVLQGCLLFPAAAEGVTAV